MRAATGNAVSLIATHLTSEVGGTERAGLERQILTGWLDSMGEDGPSGTLAPSHLRR